MKFLIDMNLSPGWIDVLTAEGWEAMHCGRPSAPIGQLTSPS